MMAGCRRFSFTISTGTIRFLCVLILVFLMAGPASADDEVKIGVLAKRGPEITLKRWQPLADYLNGKLPAYRFSIIPLSFDELAPAVGDHKVDFVLTNSSYYITLERKYGASRIVTMQNQVAGGDILSEFGGVIFSRKERDDINTLSDLRDKRFAAVDERSFGGWQMALLEMKQQKIDPVTDFEELTFLGSHDAVVNAVLDGKADAGTIRTDTLESMQLEGKIRLPDFKIINQKTHPGFPMLISSDLYPEWPLAKIRETSDHLGNAVAVALIQLPADSETARHCGIAGWTTPHDYTSVDETLRKLGLGYYAKPKQKGLQLTEAERTWLETHPVLSMGVDPDFAPYEFVNANGKHAGLAADYLQLIGDRLGVDIRMVPGLSWPGTMTQIENKQLDVVAAITETSKRDKFMLFSQPYMKYPSVIATLKDYADLQGLGDLSKRPVALVKQYAYTELALKQQPDIQPIYVDSVLEGLETVAAGKADALVADVATISYQINESKLLNLRINTLLDLQAEGLRVGVRSDYPLLVSILDKALDSITNEEKTAIRQKWIGFKVPIVAQTKLVELAPDEKAWLRNHPVIRLGGGIFPPLDFSDKKGESIGIGSDYLDLIGQKLGISFDYSSVIWADIHQQVKDKEIDGIRLLVPSERRKEYLNFTIPYQQVVYGVLTKDSVAPVLWLPDLHGKTVAVLDDAFDHRFIEQNHPQISLQPKSSYTAGIEALMLGEVDAFVGAALTIDYMVREKAIPGLRLMSLLREMSRGLSVGIRKDWPELIPILNKAINAITPEERIGIDNKWMLTTLSADKAKLRIDLSDEEKAWLKENPVIHVHNEMNWPPFNFNKDGKPAGYSIDFMNKVAANLGIKVEYVSGPSLDEFMQMVRDGSIDVMLNIVSTEERRKYLDYTTPYLEAAAGIYAHKYLDEDIHSLNDLAGKRVAMPKGFFYEELLRRHYPDIELVLLEDTKKCLEAVAFGQADATVGEIGVLNHLIEVSFMSNVRLVRPVQDRRFASIMGVAVNKDQSILRDILQKGMDAIAPDEMQALNRKWALESAKTELTELTKQDVTFLASLKEIRMCVDPDWMPLESINPDGRHIGIVAEIMDLVRDKFSIPIRLFRTSSWTETLESARAHKCDIISASMKTKERQVYLNFSDAYLELPLVVATASDKQFIHNMDKLAGRKIGIVRGYALESVLHEHYPEVHLVEVEDVKEGLDKVYAGQLYGFIDALAVIIHAIEEHSILDIKITGKLEEQWELSVGVRNDWPELQLIFNKVLAEIGKEKIHDIYHKRVAIEVVEEFDYRVMLKYLVVIIVVFLFLAYRHRQIRKFARTQEQYNERLLEMNRLITEKEELSRSLLDSTGEGIFGIDTSGKATFANPATTTLLGYTPEELLGQSIHRLVHHSREDGRPYPVNECPMMLAVLEQKPQRADDEHLWHKDGYCFPVSYSSTPVFSGGDIVGAVVAFTDITELKRNEEELERLAVTDQLTGIYNRKQLDHVLAKEIERSSRYEHSFSVIMVDIDKFKLVNDTYGHQVGDEVLKAMVTIMQERVRISDTLGRWGGEEFMLICPESELNSATLLAEEIRKIIEGTAFPTVGKKTASFGVATFHKNDKVEDVVKRADEALYQAKEKGRNRVESEK